MSAWVTISDRQIGYRTRTPQAQIASELQGMVGGRYAKESGGAGEGFIRGGGPKIEEKGKVGMNWDARRHWHQGNTEQRPN